jgi:putative hydrolase of the HAD superfamily
MIKSNINAVVFDLDNTLYNEANYFEAVLKHFLSDLGRSDIYSTSLVNIGDRLNTKDYLGDLLKKLSLYTSEMHERFFNLYCKLDYNMSLELTVVKVLEKLQSMSISLGVLTNGVVAAQKNKVKCLSLKKYVDHISYARERGKFFEKPHSLAFRDICEKLCCNLQNALFVGDHPINDIKGAKDAGMKTCWIRSPFFLKSDYADFTIDNFDELLTKIFNGD